MASVVQIASPFSSFRLVFKTHQQDLPGIVGRICDEEAGGGW